MSLQTLEQHSAEAAALLKTMANSSRLMILCSLIDGELSVSELNDRVPLSQSALSQHLAYLRNAHLVNTRRVGQTIYYSLCGEEAVQVIEVLQSIYCPD